MVYGRLTRRLRQLNLTSVKDYFSYLDAHFEKERVNFVNCFTTNLTHYFRENHHFEYLRTSFFPEFIKKNSSIKIWSAGCSTGAEPYSMAMTWLTQAKKIPIKILATDLDTNVLADAQQAIRGVAAPATDARPLGS